jgi:hypothetical protein
VSVPAWGGKPDVFETSIEQVRTWIAQVRRELLELEASVDRLNRPPEQQQKGQT